MCSARGQSVFELPIFCIPSACIVFLDTEGVGGLEADVDHDARVFALATLLCSSLVYNSLGSIDENTISRSAPSC